MHFGPRRDERFRRRILTRQTQDLMTRVEQLSDDSRTYEACRTRHKYTHDVTS